MISVINILMNLLQHETEKYIFIDTCKSQRHPPSENRVRHKGSPVPFQDMAMPDGDAFVFSLAEMLRQRVSEKAPASWKQVIFCRPARRNLLCRFGGGRGFQRDNIDPQVCTAPLPKPGPKAQSQIRPNL